MKGYIIMNMNKNINKKTSRMVRILLPVFLLLLLLTAGVFAGETEKTDYSNKDNWAYFAIGSETGKEADLFLICPTVDINEEDYNMSLSDEKTKKRFVAALNMEKGIYEDSTRMYAPYYRQMAMRGYFINDSAEREKLLEFAYEDVADAFTYYLDHENQGRPIILAGFSQGADMCYRLLKDKFADSSLQDRLVAVYALGWPCTKEMVNQYPQIKPARSETDTGTVVSFECEAPEITGSFICPADQEAWCINPLNWKTDGTVADKSLNLGACFPNASGEIEEGKEIPALCGCYVDTDRGVLKVPDVDSGTYYPLTGMEKGTYHLWDYQFFFRNLQQNVGKRLEAYLSEIQKEEETAAIVIQLLSGLNEDSSREEAEGILKKYNDLSARAKAIVDADDAAMAGLAIAKAKTALISSDVTFKNLTIKRGKTGKIAIRKKTGGGAVTYANKSGKKIKKLIKVTKAGKVRVTKKAKKGKKYTINVQATIAAKGIYKKTTVTRTFKVKVK